MRVWVTIFGLGLSIWAVGCGSKHEARVALKCMDVRANEASEEAWLKQLPAIIKFRFKTETYKEYPGPSPLPAAKTGESKKPLAKAIERQELVAVPTCVRDRAHTPNWDHVVREEGVLLRQEEFAVTYGRSIRQSENKKRFAKWERLELKRFGSYWSGKLSSIPKDPGWFDDLLDSLLPIEREIELPKCTTAEMKEVVEVPRQMKTLCQ